MRTLGIDLSSQAKKTAMCEIKWSGGFAEVIELTIGVDDDSIIAAAAKVDVVGIDSPFGWPMPFVNFVGQAEPSTSVLPPWTPEWRDILRFRLTDHHIIQNYGKIPLSVAADKIALPAMRCAGLLNALGVEDRSGDGSTLEVYPAVALMVFGIAATGAKAPGAGLDGLAVAVADLMSKVPWLYIDDGKVAILKAKDDAFDALVCSLVARAAACGLTVKPKADEGRRAKVEGWIHIPTTDALAKIPNAICPPR